MEFRDATLLRIYFAEDDSHGDLPLYHALLREAHNLKLAGGTVLRGIGGYGPDSLRVNFFQFRTEARPIVVEIIDSEEKINAFLPVAARLLDSGAITVEKIKFFATAKAG